MKRSKATIFFYCIFLFLSVCKPKDLSNECDLNSKSLNDRFISDQIIASNPNIDKLILKLIFPDIISYCNYSSNNGNNSPSANLSNFIITTTNTGDVTNFPVAGPFTFDFSAAIDANSIVVNSTIGSTSCTGSVQVSQDNFATCVSLKAATLGNENKQLIVTPLPFMRPLQTYKVRITTALKSFQGVNLGAEFTTNNYTTKDVGKYVFVAGFNGDIHYCTLNQTTGVLGAVSSVSAPNQTQFIALDPSGKFVFAHPNNTTSLYYASINQTTGAIPAPSNVTNVANGGLAYHPTLPILYATAANQIRPFSINTVSGLPTAGSVLTGGSANNIGIVIHPTAKFLCWGTSGGGNNVHSAQIASDGSLSSVISASTGSATTSYFPTIDPGGNFLYATDYGGTTGVSYFSINQTTGALTLNGNVGVPTPGQSTTIDPTGRFLYSIGTANPNSTISVFSLNSSTGLPTLVQSQTGLDSYATFMAIDPSGRFAVVGYGASGASGDKIISYSIDQQTGVLVQVTVLTAANAQSVAIY
jgi:6-phosphogluconolactonase (cycloisomerase 2 family)